MNNVASKYIIRHTFYPHVSQKVIFLKYISMLHVLAVAKHSLNTTFVLVVCWHIFLPKFKLYKKFFKYKIWSPNRDPQSRPYLSFNLVWLLDQSSYNLTYQLDKFDPPISKLQCLKQPLFPLKLKWAVLCIK